jgi:hypothetical protein
VDFDDLTREDQSIPEWATEFIHQASLIGGFTEWSGSGTGAHVFLRASPSFPPLTRNRYTRADGSRTVGIEVYTSARFAALTGFPFFPALSPTLNDPHRGDDLLVSFLASLRTHGAPVLSPALLGPIHVPAPTPKVIELASRILDAPQVLAAFTDPTQAYNAWAAHRALKSLDTSRSAWRFHLYSVAARFSIASPLPLYELFNPTDTPLHPGIPEWQSLSNQSAKPHRRYADIQRAHALVAEEQRLIALDLGEEPEPAPSKRAPPRHPANVDLAESWASLGLNMRVTKNSAVPIVGNQNFVRILTRHSHFQSTKIERNSLDGTTRVNRQPMPDTFPTRCLEPLRAVLDLSSDPSIEAVRQAIEVCADDAPYDPLQEYLTGLPPHDPAQPLLSDWLRQIGAHPDEDLPLFSRRILIGLVARAMEPGVKFDYVPVFEGPTGVGKSTLVEAIISKPFHAVMSGDLHNKDAQIALRGKWGLELAEMSAFKKSTEEARKAFFSTPADDFRPPYGRANIKVARRCVIFGTTEDHEYLTDHRGNRRYWPVQFLKPIDIQWFLLHRDALFAEALAAYRAGERFHDTVDEMKSPQRLASLEERMVMPAWQKKVHDHLISLPAPHLPDEDSMGCSGFYSTTYIANLPDLPPEVQRMSEPQLAAFFRRAGYIHHSLSYRHQGQSVKSYGFVHPHFRHLSPDQSKAFHSYFPHLFRGGIVPNSWVEHRALHLNAATEALSNLSSPEYGGDDAP